MRLIDAESLSSMRFTHQMHDSEGRLYVPFDEVAEAIFKAPTVGAVKHGRWIPFERTTEHVVCICTVCGRRVPMPTWYNYCPNCGAKMDEEEPHEQN